MTTKWMEDISPDQSPRKVARSILSQRLDQVKHWLGKTRSCHGEDPKAIHQLRVAIRRTEAALRSFASLLKRSETFRNQLRDLRRFAGGIRQADVFLMRISQMPEDETSHQLYRMAQMMTLQERHDLVARFLPEFSRVQANWEGWVKTLFESMRRGKESFADLAQEQYRRRMDRFAIALHDADTLEQQHRLRIEAKKLRYTLEIFIRCYSTNVRDSVYPLVEGLQERLGDLNDTREAMERWRMLQERIEKPVWQTHLGDLRPAFVAIFPQEQARLQTQQAALEAWRQDWNRLHQQLGSGEVSGPQPSRIPG